MKCYFSILAVFISSQCSVLRSYAFIYAENDCPDFERFLEVLSSADHSIDICVFTITDNRMLSSGLLYFFVIVFG